MSVCIYWAEKCYYVNLAAFNSLLALCTYIVFYSAKIKGILGETTRYVSYNDIWD